MAPCERAPNRQCATARHSRRLHRVPRRVVARVVQEKEGPALGRELPREGRVERIDVERADGVNIWNVSTLAVGFVAERLVRRPVAARREQRLTRLEEVRDRRAEERRSPRGRHRDRRGAERRAASPSRSSITARQERPASPRSARTSPTRRAGPRARRARPWGGRRACPSSSSRDPTVAFTMDSPFSRREVASRFSAKMGSSDGLPWCAAMTWSMPPCLCRAFSGRPWPPVQSALRAPCHFVSEGWAPAADSRHVGARGIASSPKSPRFRGIWFGTHYAHWLPSAR